MRRQTTTLPPSRAHSSRDLPRKPRSAAADSASARPPRATPLVFAAAVALLFHCAPLFFGTPLLAAPPPGVADPELKPHVGADLRALVANIDRTPLLIPLAALDAAREHRTPWAIVAYRDILRGDHHPWIHASTIELLTTHDTADLIAFGGRELAEALVNSTRSRKRPVADRARAVLRRIHDRSPDLLRVVDRGMYVVTAEFPAGKTLPTDAKEKKKPTDVGEEQDDDTPPSGRTGVGAPKQLPESPLGRTIFAAEEATIGYDVVWALDCTASMEPRFVFAVEAITRIGPTFGPLLGDVRWGLVAYRDRVDGTIPLNSGWDRVARALASLEAKDGGSPNERVDLAFRAATAKRMKWRREVHNAVLFLADAAPSSKHAAPLIRRLTKLVDGWSTLRVHGARYGVAALPGGVQDFWRDFVAAGRGSAPAYPNDLGLARTFLEGAAPKLAEDRVRRIVRLIWSVEGWGTGLSVPRGGGGGRRIATARDR